MSPLFLPSLTLPSLPHHIHPLTLLLHTSPHLLPLTLSCTFSSLHPTLTYLPSYPYSHSLLIPYPNVFPSLSPHLLPLTSYPLPHPCIPPHISLPHLFLIPYSFFFPSFSPHYFPLFSSFPLSYPHLSTLTCPHPLLTLFLPSHMSPLTLLTSPSP